MASVIPREMRPITAHRRGHGWTDRLDAKVEACRLAPFAWGSQDCMTFAADVVAEMIGVDIIADKRGSWASEAEAEAITEAEGGMENLLVQRAADHNLPECPIKFAQRGDLVFVVLGNQETAGIIVDHRVAVTGPDGLVFAPRRVIRRAWVV